MYTQVIQSVFFWSGLVVVGSWLAVELLNAWEHYRLHSAARDRLGLDEQPGQSAWEERMTAAGRGGGRRSGRRALALAHALARAAWPDCKPVIYKRSRFNPAVVTPR